MIERQLQLADTLGRGASVLLLGPRGVGKTNLAQQWVAARPNVLSINLLDPDDYHTYLLAPGHLQTEVRWRLESSRETALLVFIDEIQKVPALLDVVHLLYENHRPQVQFLLTGSSARKLRRGGANLLAGRLLALHLYPLTFRELPQPWTSLLRLGSLPGVALDNLLPEASLRAYVHNYLKEEVLEEALVRKVEAFSRFLELAGQYHGEPLNASSLARAAGISSNTVSDYFQILEDTLMVHRLPGWSASVKKQLRLAPRFFLFDNGVANALRGELRVEINERTSRFGRLFEAWVIQEAFRLNDYRQLDLKLSYWQTNTQLEVDLVVSRGAGQPLAAIEIKSGLRPSPADWPGLTSFRTEYPQVPQFCFCRCARPFRGDDGVEVHPWQEGLALLETL